MTVPFTPLQAAAASMLQLLPPCVADAFITWLASVPGDLGLGAPLQALAPMEASSEDDADEVQYVLSPQQDRGPVRLRSAPRPRGEPYPSAASSKPQPVSEANV